MKTCLASLVLVILGTGCGDIPSAEGLAVAIGVEDDECVRLCEGQTESISHPLLCEDGQVRSCGVGSEERFRVLVDYGKLSLTAGGHLDPASVQLFADAELIQTVKTGSVAEGRGAEGEYHAETAFLLPPPRRIGELVAKVDGGGGLLGESEAVTVRAPLVTLSLPGCDSPCEPQRGVGGLSVEVSSVSTIPEEVAYIEQWVDGNPRELKTSSLNPYNVAEKVAQFSLTAPAAGSAWTLVARVGVYRSAPIEVTLRAPTLKLSITPCAVLKCEVQVGTQVALRLEAPDGYVATTAQVSNELNGVRVPGQVTVTLKPFTGENGEALSVGEAFVNAPAGKAGDLWQLVAFLGTQEIYSEGATLVE